ncbi:GFA family protein [Chelativorans alearense]|uniref:GFA family protein n=1 Tax=Chelativorans alearense TaxID=2681495 RepID=UPI0013D2B3C8|nr:GFA family protein [Chelativorans alearense]
MRKTYHGSCHCGAVRFECRLDLAPEGQRSEPAREGVYWTSTFRCNCSSCLKTRFWKAFAVPEDFKLLKGEEALTEYRFGARMIRHVFCRHCGVHPFASADFDVMGGAFYAVNLVCLDDASDEELAGAPIIYEDGRHDAWDRAPEVTSYL